MPATDESYKSMEQVAYKLWEELRTHADDARIAELNKFQQCRAAANGGAVNKLTDFR